MHYERGVLHLGGIPAPELIRQFGSPLYVYEGEILKRQIANIRRAFTGIPLQPAYAMKANSNLALLRIISAAGFYFDAVSPGEVDLLRYAGVAPDRIWFTCSNVSDEDFRSLRDPEIVVNVNGMSELDRCIRLRVTNPIALRVNPDVGAGHHRDVVTGGFGVKFGFDLAELRDARMVAEAEGLDVVALHAHIGSGITEVRPLLESARILLDLSAHFGSLRMINFGGGIATPYRPGEREFPLDEYGEGLRELAAPILRSRGLTAILEPGRYVTAECGTLLTTATTRHISSGYEWIGCDTGFNHLMRPTKYGSYHHIVNASRGDDSMLRLPQNDEVRAGNTIVAGNICESGDVFTRDVDGIVPRELGAIAVGDVLALCDAGAYGFSMASEYNARYLPAEVLVEDGAAALTRRRRTFDDFILEQLPVENGR
jgi:diaminopimelate decarboxylase